MLVENEILLKLNVRSRCAASRNGAMKPVPIALIILRANYYKDFIAKKDINTGNTGRHLSLFANMAMLSL
jgi:hypothetical protein